MFTYQQLRGFLLLCLVSIISGAVFTGCGNNAESKEVVIAQIKPETPSTKANDEKFLVRAAEMYFEEILLAKLAQQRGSTNELKEYARNLENYSRDSKSEIASLGIMESIKVPSAPTQTAHAAYDTLNKVVVEEFDTEFLRQVIQRHNDAIAYFENASKGAVDPDIQAKAIAMIPSLKDQLSKAMALESNVNAVAEIQTAP